MGLDAGFELRKRSNGEMVDNYEMAYFRKYYALDNWIRTNCEELVEDYKFIVTKENLEELFDTLSEVVDVFRNVKFGDIMDNFQYGLSSVDKFYFEEISHNSFSPFVDKSFNSAEKLLRLYYFVSNLLCDMHIINEHYEIIYYSSY